MDAKDARGGEVLRQVSKRQAALALVAAIAGAVATAGPASALPRTEGGGAVGVVAGKSFCLYTGIADVYTGDGRVGFWITLRNTGSSVAKVDVSPIRYYDDGGMNQSPMDTLIDVRVPAHSTKKIRSPLYKYKAHEHEVAACSVRVDSGREVRVAAIHA